MPIYVGDESIGDATNASYSAIYVGDGALSEGGNATLARRYVGDTLVWQKGVAYITYTHPGGTRIATVNRNGDIQELAGVSLSARFTGMVQTGPDEVLVFSAAVGNLIGLAAPYTVDSDYEQIPRTWAFTGGFALLTGETFALSGGSTYNSPGRLLRLTLNRSTKRYSGADWGQLPDDLVDNHFSGWYGAETMPNGLVYAFVNYGTPIAHPFLYELNINVTAQSFTSRQVGGLTHTYGTLLRIGNQLYGYEDRDLYRIDIDPIVETFVATAPSDVVDGFGVVTSSWVQ